MAGLRSTNGSSTMLDHVPSEDSAVVTSFKKQGAIILVKGNLPKLVHGLHTDSFWGVAKSIYDRTRSTGGSSGGDAGLVAARCVPMGFGSDFGGSVRSPGLFTGLYSIKATSTRISAKGSSCLKPHVKLVPGGFSQGLGPLCKSADDVALAMEAVMIDTMFDMDRTIARMPFNKQVYEQYQNPKQKKIRIGYFDNLKILETSNAVKRAVKMSKEELESQGYELVPFKITYDEEVEIFSLFLQSIWNYESATLLRACYKEKE